MMRLNPAEGEKPLHWIGSSLRDIQRFPIEARRTIGFALAAAQYGGKHPSAKPWKGEGPGVLEIVRDFDGDTYRTIYTVRFPRSIYVLHAFQKKSPHGITTRLTDIALVSARLKTAAQHHAEHYG